MGLFDSLGSPSDWGKFGDSTWMNPTGNAGFGNYENTLSLGLSNKFDNMLGGKKKTGGGGNSEYANFLSMYPEYTPGYDPNTMSLTKRMQELDPQYNKGLKAFQDEALRKGTSGWMNQAKLSGDLAEQTRKEHGAQDVAGQTAQAQAALAAQGGLSSGAKERTSEQGIKNYMNMNQDLSRQGMQNNLQLSMQDQSNKLKALGELPGMEQSRMADWEKARQADIQNQMGETARRNQYNMDLYQTRGQAMGADRQAQATENSGSSGSSFICTALREDKLMTKKESRQMTKLMLGAIFSRADFFVWYFTKGESLIRTARNQFFRFEKIKKLFVDDIIEMLGQDETAAQNLYIGRTGALATHFLGPCGYKDSMAKPGKIKAYLRIPLLLLIPAVWKWSFKFGASSLRRKASLLRKGYIKNDVSL